jgi:hypothetical protein
LYYLLCIKVEIATPPHRPYEGEARLDRDSDCSSNKNFKVSYIRSMSQDTGLRIIEQPEMINLGRLGIKNVPGSIHQE